MPKLVIKQESQESQVELIHDITTLGRADDNIIQLKDIKISRHHCQIIKTREGYKLADTGSSNGTLVNGRRVESHLLKENDLIKVGNIEITFLAAEEDATLGQAGKFELAKSSGTFLPAQAASSAALKEDREEIGTSSDPAVLGKSETVQVPPTPTQVSEEPVEAIPASLPTPAEEPESASIVEEVEKTLPEQPPHDIRKPTRLLTKPLSKKTTSVSRGLKGKSLTPSKFSKLSGIKGKRTTTIQGLRVRKSTEEEGVPTKTTRQASGSKTTIIIAAVVILIALVGLIIALNSSGGGRKANLKEQEEILNQARELAQKGDYQDALNIYRNFREKYKDSKYLQTVNDNIAQLETILNREATATQEWQALNQKIKSASTENYSSLLKELDTFIAKYSGTQAEKIARQERPGIERIAASCGSDEMAFANARERIDRECIQQKNYRGALNEWDLFLRTNPKLSDIIRNKVEMEKAHIEKLIQEQQ